MAVAGLAAADGGFGSTSWGWAAIALAGVAIAALARRPRIRLCRLEAGFLAALAALAGWAALSALWSRSAPGSILEAQRLLVYVAAAGAFLLSARRGSARGLLAGVLVAATAVGVAGLVHRAASGDDDPGWPVGYDNGLAILLALGVAAGVGLAAEASTSRGRVAAGVPAVVLLAPLATLGSRGAWLSLAIGLGCAAVLRLAAWPLAFPAAVAAGLAVAIVVGVQFNDERAAYWRVAIDEVQSEPALGTGAGTYGRVWLVERERPLQAHDAHNLYLETLGEVGPAGLAFLAGALAVPIAAAVSVRRDPLAAAAAAPYAAFLVHAGIDWDWELASVTVAALAVAAVLLLRARPRAPVGTLSPRVRLATTVAAAAIAVAAAVGLVGNTAVARAESAAADGRWGEAEARARRATRLAPWSATSWRLLGEAQLELGRREGAVRSLRRAVAKDPSDPEAWLALAHALRGNERARAVAQALRLNPLGVAAD